MMRIGGLQARDVHRDRHEAVAALRRREGHGRAVRHPVCAECPAIALRVRGSRVEWIFVAIVVLAVWIVVGARRFRLAMRGKSKEEEDLR
jgi:hypothetical protein